MSEDEAQKSRDPWADSWRDGASVVGADRREASFHPGAVLAGKYEILRRIGEGGMGTVYEARQAAVDRVVAIKVLSAYEGVEPTHLARFEQEARVVARLQHPHIVTLHDVGRTADGHPFLVMERLFGQPLSRLLQRGLDVHRAAHVIRQIVGALACAHRHGIVHRDLKPTNVLLVEVDGDPDFVKLLDFGVAKLLFCDPPITKPHAAIGTPRYMAPEQAMASTIDHRADIYGLGALFFEMLTGRPPFIDPTWPALLEKILHQDPPRFGEVRPDLAIDPLLESIVRRALKKHPEERFLSAESLGRALDEWRGRATTERTPHLPHAATALATHADSPRVSTTKLESSFSAGSDGLRPSSHTGPDGSRSPSGAGPVRRPPGRRLALLAMSLAGLVVGFATVVSWTQRTGQLDRAPPASIPIVIPRAVAPILDRSGTRTRPDDPRLGEPETVAIEPRGTQPSASEGTRRESAAGGARPSLPSPDSDTLSGVRPTERPLPGAASKPRLLSAAVIAGRAEGDVARLRSRARDLVACYEKADAGGRVMRLRFVSSEGALTVHVDPKGAVAEKLEACVLGLKPPLGLTVNEGGGAQIVSAEVGRTP